MYRDVGGIDVPLGAAYFQITQKYYVQRTHDELLNFQIAITNAGNIIDNPASIGSPIVKSTAGLYLTGRISEGADPIILVEMDLTGGNAIADGQLVVAVQAFPIIEAIVADASFTSTAPTIIPYLQE